jgi:hypothetical protein
LKTLKISFYLVNKEILPFFRITRESITRDETRSDDDWAAISNIFAKNIFSKPPHLKQLTFPKLVQRKWRFMLEH